MQLQTLLLVALLLSSSASAQTDTQCLASAIYHEARGESKYGQVFVAWVVLNRAKEDKGVCRAIKRPNQFPWYKSKKDLVKYDTNSFALAKYLVKSNPASPVKYFHKADGRRRVWTRNLVVVRKIGKHIFYKDKDD